MSRCHDLVKQAIRYHILVRCTAEFHAAGFCLDKALGNQGSLGVPGYGTLPGLWLSLIHI